MKTKHFSLLIILLLATIVDCFAQYTQQSPKPASISDAFKGVKSFAWDLYHNGNVVIRPGNVLFIEKYFLDATEKYLTNLLPDAHEGQDFNYPSTTQLTVNAYMTSSTYMGRNGAWHWKVNNIKFEFRFGYSETYVYNFYLPGLDIISGQFDNKLYNSMIDNIYGYICKYDSRYVLELQSYKTEWTEYTMKQYYDQNADYVEGIYESTKPNIGYTNKYKLGLIRNNNEQYPYVFIYLDGGKIYKDWSEGEIKAWLIPTASKGVYKSKWLSAHKEFMDGYVYMYDGSLKTIIEGSEETYLKLYPY